MVRVRGALSLGRRNVLLRNALSLTVLQGSTYLIPLVLTPYLARVLGVEQFGMLGIATSIILNLTTFTDWGFSLSATREVAQNRSDPVELRNIFWNTLAAKGMLSLASFIALIAIIAYLGLSSPLSWIILAGGPQVLGNVVGVNWFLLGIEAAPSMVVGALIGRLSVIPLTLYFVHSPRDTILAAAIAASGPVLSAAIALPIALRMRPLMPVFFTFGGAWRQLRGGWHIFLANAGALLYTQLNVIVVGAFAGPVQAGLLFGAQKLAGACKSVMGPLGAAAYPRLSSLVPKQPGEAIRLAMRILAFQGAITLGLFLFLLVAAPYLVRLFLGAGYEGAVPAVRWLSGTVFVIGISNVLGLQIMLPFGMKQLFMRILTTSGMFNVISIGPLSYYFGATGAAISVLITEGIVTTLMAVALWDAGILSKEPPQPMGYEKIRGQVAPTTGVFLMRPPDDSRRGSGFAAALMAVALVMGGTGLVAAAAVAIVSVIPLATSMERWDFK
ncbi:MAG: flippase [Methylocapsa sp.]|nr:flippase [Methylocapsa sp.]